MLGARFAGPWRFGGVSPGLACGFLWSRIGERRRLKKVRKDPGLIREPANNIHSNIPERAWVPARIYPARACWWSEIRLRPGSYLHGQGRGLVMAKDPPSGYWSHVRSSAAPSRGFASGEPAGGSLGFRACGRGGTSPDWGFAETRDTGGVNRSNSEKTIFGDTEFHLRLFASQTERAPEPGRFPRLGATECCQQATCFTGADGLCLQSIPDGMQLLTHRCYSSQFLFKLGFVAVRSVVFPLRALGLTFLQFRVAAFNQEIAVPHWNLQGTLARHPVPPGVTVAVTRKRSRRKEGKGRAVLCNRA